jgi:hypothetical protein
LSISISTSGGGASTAAVAFEAAPSEAALTLSVLVVRVLRVDISFFSVCAALLVWPLGPSAALSLQKKFLAERHAAGAPLCSNSAARGAELASCR